MTGGSGVIIRRPSVAESLRILLGEADCDGALGVVEMALSPGASGPPLHLHPTHAEAFYVLAGQLSLQVGEELVTGGPGTWACAPKDVPHTLGNFGTDEGRLLCMFAPGGFERRFERMLAKQHGDAVLAELSEAERATRLIGPPLVSPAQPSRPDPPEFGGGAS
jgi:quercetin dioxygenase-like cupin family protein